MRPMTSLSRLLAVFLFVLPLVIGGCATQPVSPKVTLAVAQVDRGVMLWLPESVLFEFGKSALDLNDAGPYLDRVAQLLREKSSGDVLLEGHTDNVGSESYNLTLSERRAEVVRQALLARGLSASRVKFAGMGMSQPLAPNDTEAGRRLNRRVEIIVLGEKLENLTRGEPDNAFEQAVDRLKRLLVEPPAKS